MISSKICLIQPLLLVMAQKSLYDIEVLLMFSSETRKRKNNFTVICNPKIISKINFQIRAQARYFCRVT